MKYLFISLFLMAVIFLLPEYSRAQQIKKFSEDTVKFIEELGEYFDNVNQRDKKDAEFMMENFTLAWRQKKFSPTQQVMIYQVSNAMLSKRMRAIPHFYDFLNALLSFTKSSQDDASFMAWINSLHALIDKSSSKYFLDYVTQTIHLLNKNHIYESRATIWATDNENYRFEFIDNTIRISFPSLTLSCYANDDSAVILNTKGVYDPLAYKWQGEGGRVLWNRAGFAHDEVYADLSSYEIFMKYSKYTADSVVFVNTKYFNKPMLGYLEEKVLADVTPERASYPNFSSYDKRTRISNLFENIDYEGGFEMKGARFLGSGGENRDAYIYITKDGQDFIKISAKNYTIRTDRLASSFAAVSIFFEGDSIFHPGLQMKYMDENKELTLTREQEGMSASPFFNSYHKVDMYCEQMIWDLNKFEINFQMIRGVGTEGRAVFESEDYYTDYKYYRLQGMDEQHPLHVIRSFSQRFNTKEIEIGKLVRYWNTNKGQADPILINLSIMGFILYDYDDGMIYVKDRLFNYINAKNGKRDYDVIQFESVISAEANATLSLIDFDLLLRGVGRVYLSDSQLVYIYPTNQEITLKKNRDFTFDGTIHAGLFDFFGHECSFEYDKYKLNLPAIDSMSFLVRSFRPDKYGKYSLKRVKTVLSDLSGDILIDHPDNKSGLKQRHEYPIFNSKKDCYVYYDKKTIQKGVYDRDRFYFHVFPFTIDSLVRFTTEGLEFNGYLTSADIFPDIEEPLTVRPDYSLGFVHNTSVSGLPMYNGKGQFKKTVDLSHYGLRGDGYLDYLSSKATSNDFYFFPDSTNAIAQEFVIEEQLGATQYPDVDAREVYIHWEPYKDNMLIKKIDNPITMYKHEVDLNGWLSLTPASLTGDGTLDFEDAKMNSDLFLFRQHEIDADTADFRLKAYELEDFAFSTKNYKSHIDFDERKGVFKSNGGGSLVEFPVNMYVCFMDEFEWFMDEEEIALTSRPDPNVPNTDNLNLKELVDIELGGSEFISVHPAQDSLRFFTTKGKFSLRDNIIKAEDVKLIRVADAAIYPFEGDVTIYKKAEMETLKKAKILANTTTKFHTIYDAVINVHGRFNYSGMGNYDYVDINSNSQQIYLDKIRVDTTGQTYGTGNIKEEQSFTLNPYFEYTGDVTLLANNEFLTFSGGTRISHDCDTLPRFQVKFETEINPEEVLIPVNTPLKDIKGNKLEAGIMFSHTQNDIYPAFLSVVNKYSDTKMVGAEGYLTFEDVSREYRISSKEKLFEMSLPGNFLSLSQRNCMTYGEGKLDMGANLGQVNMQSFGNIKHWMAVDSTRINMVMLVDFYFEEQALSLFAETMVGYLLPAAELTDDLFSKTLAELLGQEDADEALSDLNMYGFIREKKISKQLQHTLFLTDVNLYWSDITQSFISDGPIGIVNIGESEINKYVEGKIEIAKKRSGDVITVYLEPDETEWYFFSYSRGLMQAFSSNKEFNTFILDQKPEKRRMDVKSGEPPYRYSLSTERKRRYFLRKFENTEPEPEEKDDDY